MSIIGRVKIDSSKAMLVMLTGLCLLLDCIAGIFVNIDFVTVCIWFIFIVSLFFIDFEIFIKYIFYVLQYTLNIVAIFLIENNTFYLNELGRATERFNALLPIVFAHWIFFSVLIIKDPTDKYKWLDDNSEQASNYYNRRFAYLMAMAFLISCSYLLYRAIPLPSYTLGVDRFIYERDYISGLWKQLHSFTIWLLPAIVVIWHKEKSVSVLFPAGLFCVYMALVGHKLGIFLQVLLLFLPAIVSRFNLWTIDFKSIKRVLAIGATVSLALFFSVYGFMKRTFGVEGDAFSRYLYSRLAQQGQMWWAVYGKESGGGLHIGEMFHSMGAFYKLDGTVLQSRDYGITKMMKLVTPADIYKRKLSNNSVYAFSTEASFYYYLKMIGMMVVLILLAVALIYITNWYWKAVLRCDCFTSIVAGRFYLSMMNVLMQTNFVSIFSRRMLLLTLLYIFYRCMINKRTINYTGVYQFK